jgi:hypothetical protein
MYPLVPVSASIDPHQLAEAKISGCPAATTRCSARPTA